VAGVILARHGESELSARGIVNGVVGTACGLTPAGVEQARELGRALADLPLDLCVTSPFERVRETADLALEGRDVPRLVLDDLGEPNYGAYEGRPLEDYRAWAQANASNAAPEGGESRVAIVQRYARGFRVVLARGEELILVVAHSLPIAYVLAARDGEPPAPRVPLVAYARPYPLRREELERAVDALEAWAAAPTW
jgi:broad specificity phosphatase PhoE